MEATRPTLSQALSSGDAHKPSPPPFYNPLDPLHPRIWPGYTLVMPVCAVANIGQLACDLLISTLLARKQCRLAGRIYSPALMATVGPNAFQSQGPPTTTTEVYESKHHKLAILQQRTSYFRDLKSIFVEELVNWIKESRFDRVLVLTSAFAQSNSGVSLLAGGSPIRSITTKLFEPDEHWQSAGVEQLADRISIKRAQDQFGYSSYLPGSGMTKSLIAAFERAFIQAAFLVDFCSEGFNILDCYQIICKVDLVLNLKCNPTTSFLSGEADDPSGRIGQTTADHHGQGRPQHGWVEPLSWTH